MWLRHTSSVGVLMICGLVSIPHDLHAQAIARSNGIGVRASYWSLADQPTKFSFSDTRSQFDVTGLGGWLNYFSRLNNRWYMDFQLGTIVRATGETEEVDKADVDVSLLVPFLFGVRYDLLSSSFHSSFQPYLGAGIGPYWATSFRVRNVETGEEITGEGRLLSGAYAGGGVNLLISSWLALNFELKYHFVDLNVGTNLRNFRYGKEFSGMEFGLGFSFMWGHRREMFRIKEIKVIVKDLYPAYYQFYNTYPIAMVTIQNVAGYSIDVNVRSYIRGYSDRPKDSGFVRLDKGEIKDIPVTAIFGSKLHRVSQRRPAVLDIKVEARAGGRVEKEISAQLMVHSRNAWNGEIDKLGYFVTTEDEAVMSFGRQVLDELPPGNDGAVVNFTKAVAIFQALARMNIRYHSDPNIPFYKDDRVQYAAETLELRTGDCDDLAVLCSSLLESQGINTAFVDVQDPQKEIAHLYLMFDTAVPASRGDLISSNEKRYAVRENSVGQKTIWIPVETTLIPQGFDAAWKAGALEYLQDGLLRGGLVEGWVRVIDVD